ncbi:DUF6531 domain-containing protein [Streptomyces sp. NPDC001903]|uniref:DUF6531 domain-containing protein n=1 Tax=Streptomyces sp. NPDC001903 TaxID=3364622 RepID=UPI0036A788FD
MGYTVPDWADTLLDVIGVAWPNIDEDDYRHMADALREFADDLLDDGQLANNHIERLLSASKGESIEALNAHWNKVKGKHFKDLAGAARTIAGAMDLAADAVYGMKVAAEIQLGYLAAEAGIALSLIPVTAGLSSLFGAAAMRATQEVIKRLIKECVEEAVGYIVSALTEPAVAALEGMAADLVVQLGSMALGFQDGVDLGQTGKAGKDGFSGGVQSGKEALHLASAGGSSDGAGTGGSGLADLHIEHAEHTRASTKLNSVSTGIHGKTTSKLTKAKHHHGRTRGRDSIARAIDPVADKAMAALAKATKAMGDHVGTTLPKAVRQISTDHKKTDQDIHDGFNRQRKAGRGADGNGGGKASGSPRKGEDSTRTKPDSLRDAKNEPRRNAIPLTKKTCKNDPVDVATGEMTLQHTDLALPGVLPLVLTRTHLSSYRFGQWFGRSWASTLDERIEPDPVGNGAVWAREDGSLLIYPRLPRPGDGPVHPIEGPGLPLSCEGQYEDETVYTVSDAHTGIIRSFTGSPYRASPASWLTSVEDRHGNAITISRRSDGAPSTITHSGGYSVLVTTDNHRIDSLSVRSPEGPVEVRRFGYDPRGNLDAIFNDSGLPLGLTYDAQDRITSWTDRNSSTFRYVYDEAGRVIETVGPQGFLSSSFTYGETHPETGHRVTRYTNSVGSTEVFHINEALQVVAETTPLGATAYLEFDAADRLLAATDPLGHTTRLERNDAGDVVAMTAADGTRTTASYDGDHRLVEIIERGGARYQYLHGEDGSLRVIDPEGAYTTYSRNAIGSVSRIVSPTGLATHIISDGAGLPLEVIAPDGTRAVCVRDAFGRITSVVDALGGTLTQGWTVEGKLSWRSFPDGDREEWQWDGEGNLLAHTDRMGRTTAYAVTDFDRTSSATSRDDGTYRFSYDTELRLSQVTNPRGLTWTYAYDAAGRLVTETDFDGRTLTYEHDAAGQLTRRINAVGQSIAFERDALGRVIRLVHDDGAASLFSYGPAGHCQRITNPHADIALEHDRAGRLLSESVNGRVMRFGYDAQGRRTERRTPSDAVSLLQYDEGGLALYTTGEHSFRFDRDPMGRETGRTLDGGFTLRQDWDPVGRLTHQSLTALEADVLERSFTYQADGSPTSIDDSRLGRRSYTLDPAGRITEVRSRGWTEQYAYDTAGDQTRTRLPERAPGQDEAGEREYSGTRLVCAGRTRYTYDAQGRLTERTITTLSGKPLRWRFTWNAEDRLTHVHTPQGHHWRYAYDALGRRVSKERLTSDGSVAEACSYTWDGCQLAEQDDGITTTVWDYAGLFPLAQREVKKDSAQREIDRRFFAIVADLSGIPSALVAPDGSVAWHARSTAWGATQWNRDASAFTPLRYPGQILDPETGFHYNFNRYYDPATGRYISPDPLGLAPALNHYTYVPNPFTLWDPLGLAGCDADPTWGGKVVFVRDEHGRPFEMHATVTRNMLNEGTHANNTLKPPGFIHGTDHNQARGHMLARMLGGSGDTLDNLFTITQNPTNSPHMRDLEQMIYNAVAGDPSQGIAGQTVQYSVYLEYTDDLADSVPARIYMAADGRNGFQLDTDFPNPDHAAQQQRRRRGNP